MKKILMIMVVACLVAGIANAQSGKECEVATSGEVNGHEWVDLGLSVKWATCNVGASSPSDYGYLLEWGALNESQDYAKVNNEIGGNPQYDVATATWGSSWRLPTEHELQELIDKCEWECATEGRHDGYRVTGPTGNSIFLPAAGLRIESERYDVGDYGGYWSSTTLIIIDLSSDPQVVEEYNDDAFFLSIFGLFGSDKSCQFVKQFSRGCGMSVRPVLRETIEYVPIPIVDENIDFDENEFTNQDLGATTDKFKKAVEEIVSQPSSELVCEYEEIFVAVEEQAEFPGGQKELMQWIRTNLRYPDDARENNIEGRVVVKLVIEKDGRVTNVKVVKGVREDLDNEAVRLCESMPRWSPGKNNGIAVRSYFTLPVTFRLTK